MAEPLKNIFSRPLLEGFAHTVHAAWKPFDQKDFLHRVFDAGWEQRELKQRMRHIAVSLRAALPATYPAALEVVVKTTEKLLAERGESMAFDHCFLPDFVEVFGTEDPDRSVPALAIITRWCSAEFAIPPIPVTIPGTYVPAENACLVSTRQRNGAAFGQRRFSPTITLGHGHSGAQTRPLPYFARFGKTENRSFRNRAPLSSQTT